MHRRHKRTFTYPNIWYDRILKHYNFLYNNPNLTVSKKFNLAKQNWAVTQNIFFVLRFLHEWMKPFFAWVKRRHG